MNQRQSLQINELYSFEPFLVDPAERRLLRDGSAIKIRPKSFDLLLILIDAAGTLKTRDELVRAVWPTAVVEEHGLTVCMSALRKALGEDEDQPRYVETVRGHGYRFIAPVRVVNRAALGAAEPSVETTDTASSAEAPSLATSVVSRRWQRRPLATAVILIAAFAVFAASIFAFLQKRSGWAPPPASIAVMRFENSSGNERDAYFATGIQQSILNKLTRVSELKVISRSSTDNYPDRPASLEQIAKELGVATVLEGTVLSADEHVVVNVQLLDPSNRRHLWSGSYKRTLDDVFEVENDIAAHIAETLKSKLLPIEAARIAQVPTQNAQAYRHYLKANYYADQVIRSNSAKMPAQTVNDAQQLYRDAIALDPRFALAYARLSELQLFAFRNRVLDSASLADDARVAAEQALSLDPELADAHRAMGYVHYYAQLDYSAALQRFQRAVELAPNDPETLAAIPFIHRRQNKLSDAIEALQQIAIIDPRSPRWPYETGLTLMMQHRYDEAEQQFALALAMEPNHTYCLSFRSRALLLAGKFDEAEKVLSSAESVADPLGLMSTTRFEAALLQRDPQRALSHIQAQPEWVQATIYGPKVPKSLLEAEALSRLGDTVGAAAAYQRAQIALESPSSEHADDGRLSALAIAYMGMGNSEQALVTSRLALEMSPASKDLVDGVFNVWVLAKLYASMGDAIAAVDQLRDLLAMHSGMFVSAAALRSDPTWDPIRSHPAFTALLQQQ